jgi:hypothetical protein
LADYVHFLVVRERWRPLAVAPLWEARRQQEVRTAVDTTGSWCQVAGALRNTGLVLVGLLLLALPAAAQLKLGDFDSSASGVISTGYTGDYGNQIDSDHSLAFGGSGTVSGFYYNPNFISFTISPYANQARDNSAFQSISNASGVNLNSTIFGGSHFPGSISYSKSYNSEGNFAIPGVANYTTKGNSDTLGINWSEMVPDLPSLTANFQMGSNQYSIYGSNDTGSTDNKSFGLRSAYTLKGFNMTAYFSDGDSHADIPQILDNSSQSETATSSNRSYGFAVGHKLPFHGGFSGNFNSSYVDSDYAGYSYNGAIDTYTATAAFQPTQKFHVSVSTDYSDNLTGSLYQAVTASGGIVTPPEQGQSSHAFDLLTNASYAIMPNLQALASADHRQQYFLGKSYSADGYGGGLTYGRVVFGGSFNAAFTATDNTTSTSSENVLGFSGTVNYNKRFDGWTAGAFFNYAQNVQTLLITYMSSTYGYGGNIRRRWGKFGTTAGASFNRTGLTEQAGTTSSSESFNASVSYSPWINLTGSYSKSNGNGIESGAGLILTQNPEPVLGANDLIIFGGTSYSFGLSSNPMRRLTLSASFAKADSSSNLLGIASSNNTKMINTLFQYQFRKMYLNGGYSNLVQGFSASGLPPENISAFYIGVSRWFNFF